MRDRTARTIPVYDTFISLQYMEVIDRALMRQKVAGALSNSINRSFFADADLSFYIGRRQAYDRRFRRMVGRLMEGAARAAAYRIGHPARINNRLS